VSTSILILSSFPRVSYFRCILVSWVSSPWSPCQIRRSDSILQGFLCLFPFFFLFLFCLLSCF
jgi:hypothetical protein